MKNSRSMTKIMRDTWANMKARCHTKTNRSYPNYGGRGITVCDEWRDPATGFKAFWNDVGDRPDGDYSLDRTDNDKGYEPGNVRWATRSEQQMNKRRFNHGEKKRTFTHKGLTMSGPEWARQLGIKPTAFNARVRDGLPEAAIFYRGRLPRGMSSNLGGQL